MTFDAAIKALPLVAILRGLRPEEAEAVVGAIVDAGFRLVEVPLNSPDPLVSIGRLQRRFGDVALVGAGTVLNVEQAKAVAATGATLCISPNTDQTVIRAAKAAGMISIPGAATPSEAFAALGAGADAVKMFPAEAMPPVVVKAWKAVMPQGTVLMPVGGISPDAMAAFVAAGAGGFGLGSALYKPGQAASEVGLAARAFVSAWRSLDRA